MLNDAKKKEEKKVFKSLYEVKDRYLPHPDLEFLEGKDTDLTREAFMQTLKKVAHPVQAQPCEEK
jgi:hypothetical protein